MRGGELAWEFKTYNPPRTSANWVNIYSQVPKDNQLIHHSLKINIFSFDDKVFNGVFREQGFEGWELDGEGWWLVEERVGDGEAAGGEHGEEELASVGDQDLLDSFHGFFVLLLF